MLGRDLDDTMYSKSDSNVLWGNLANDKIQR
jgi:hypothetical protein